jgi:hypothetical protein
MCGFQRSLQLGYQSKEDAKWQNGKADSQVVTSTRYI